MHLALISDTHVDSPDDLLIFTFEKYLQSADMLIHCGDFTGEETYAYLNSHPNFLAVRGNCDYFPGSADLPANFSMNIGGRKVSAAHGWGRRHEVAENVARSFGPGPDLVLYGHTHERFVGRASTGALVVNPGSLFNPKKGVPSSARIDTDNLDVRFVDLNIRLSAVNHFTRRRQKNR